MITKTGGDLSAVIITEPEQDWQAFATWYSFFKNIPDADISIVCLRNGSTPFSYYQWAKRLNIHVKHKDRITDPYINWLSAVKAAKPTLKHDKVLVATPLCMALDVLDTKTLSRLNTEQMIYDESMGFVRSERIDKIMEDFYLNDKVSEVCDLIWVDAKKEKPSCLARYEKGCGKWINTAKGCPFSSAGGLVTAEMTVNERRIIELWQKMVPLYNAVV